MPLFRLLIYVKVLRFSARLPYTPYNEPPTVIDVPEISRSRRKKQESNMGKTRKQVTILKILTWFLKILTWFIKILTRFLKIMSIFIVFLSHSATFCISVSTFFQVIKQEKLRPKDGKATVGTAKARLHFGTFRFTFCRNESFFCHFSFVL